MQSPPPSSAKSPAASADRSLLRRAKWSLILLLGLLPVFLWGSQQGLRSMFNAPLLWVDHDSPARADFNQFLELFGAHEMVVVTWEGCHVDDPRLVTATEALEEVSRQRSANGQVELFNQVLSGKTVVDGLTARPVNLPRQVALDRLEGVLVGHDGVTSCLVVELTDEGGIRRRETLPLITETVANAVELTGDQLILSGPAVDGMAIDDESIRSIDAYSIPATVISLILCWYCLRSIPMTIAILLIGVWGQGFMLAAVHFTGSSMNAILIVLPPLVFMLTVSAGVHLANYYLEEVKAGSGKAAPLRALQKAKGPCTLAAVTTAIGLVSLSISEVEPVRQFGQFGACGLICCVAFLFLLVPGVQKWMLARRGLPEVASEQQSNAQTEYLGVARFITRWGLPIRFFCVAVMILGGLGLFRLRTSVNVVSLLDANNRVVRDFEWIQERVSPLVPIEVVVHFDRDCDLELIERLIVLAAVQHQLGGIEELDGEMSALTFMPGIPRGVGVRSSVRKRVFTKLVEESRENLIRNNYLAETDDGEAWRISARIPGEAEFDYGKFLDRLDSELAPVIEKIEDRGVSISSTGVLSLVYQIQKALLSDLFTSFLTALVLVAITMMITLRSVTCGLLAMLPNVFPTLVLFGGLGWVGQAIDIGSVMTASVALGIAVDGTFHFLKWFVHAVRHGAARESAIRLAYQHCGRALTQTTIICACGMLVYWFSDFLPARNFAVVLVLMLVTALVGDLVLLPALLAGWLGRILVRIYQPTSSTEVAASSSDSVATSPSSDQRSL